MLNETFYVIFEHRATQVILLTRSWVFRKPERIESIILKWLKGLFCSKQYSLGRHFNKHWHVYYGFYSCCSSLPTEWIFHFSSHFDTSWVAKYNKRKQRTSHKKVSLSVPFLGLLLMLYLELTKILLPIFLVMLLLWFCCFLGPKKRCQGEVLFTLIYLSHPNHNQMD